MKTINLLHVSHETRNTIKQQVIRLHKKGKTGVEIADNVNISIFAVSRIAAPYKKKGMGSLKEKTRGRKHGEKRLLILAQEREIQRIIIGKYPEQMKLSFALWIRGAI